ncbi:DNA-methyltransferase [Rothia terrae]|nr:DNA methyltransferase [Rothia terrae]
MTRFDVDGHCMVVQADNLAYLAELPDASFTMIYIDPPFNTGKVQTRRTLTTKPVEEGEGDRVGFAGKSYSSVLAQLSSYSDTFEDYWAFLEPRIREAHRLLAEDGTLYLHLDWREVHYAKVMCDMIFGRECFLNEIVWAYDFGAKSTKRWPTKHDNILVYVKNPDQYYFNTDEVDREPYMAPGLVTAEKAARGKLPTDVWWHTIVSPTGKEKTGYPTQKPLGLLRRMIAASTREGDWVLDFFAGSGTTGAAAAELGRRFVCIDQNPPAIKVMKKRLNTVGVRKAKLLTEMGENVSAVYDKHKSARAIEKRIEAETAVLEARRKERAERKRAKQQRLAEQAAVAPAMGAE